MHRNVPFQKKARLPYRNNTCINKCAAYSVNTWALFRYGSLSQKKIQAFPERGHPRPHRDTLPRPRSPRCLDQCRALNACDASTPSIFSQFLLSPHMPKRAKDVLGRPDSGLSE